VTTQMGYLIVYVSDVNATTAFYERSFGLAVRFAHESGQYTELETGSTVLAFAEDDFAASNNGIEHRRSSIDHAPAGVSITLIVDDVDAAWHRAIDAGAIPTSEPTIKPWGQTVSHVRDNNGLLVELATPVSQ
jgi:lactoylglutathione lyase